MPNENDIGEVVRKLGPVGQRLVDALPEERKKWLRENLGPEDSETKAVRDELHGMGVAVVFGPPGYSDKQTLEILKDPRTQAVLADPRKAIRDFHASRRARQLGAPENVSYPPIDQYS